MAGFVEWLLESVLSLPSGLAGVAAQAVVILGVFGLAGLATIAARRMLVRLATRLATRTEARWDDVLVESGVIGRLAPLAPGILVYLLAPVFGSAQPWVETLAVLCLVGIVLRILDALLDAFLEIYRDHSLFHEVPLRGAVRLARIGMVVLGTLFALTTAIDRLPTLLGEEFQAALRADRADDVEDIPHLLSLAREAVERVIAGESMAPEEGAELLKEVRERGPALVDAADQRAAEIAEPAQSAD